MKIRSYQYGAVLPNLPDWKTVTGPKEAGVSEKTSASSDYSKEYVSLMKDVLKDLTGKALPNEMGAFNKQLAAFIANPNPRLIPRLLSTANHILNSKQELETMTTEMLEHDAVGEIARFDKNVYCLDNGVVKIMTTDQVKKRNKTKNPVKVLSNGELVNLRRHDPEFAFNFEASRNIGQAVSMKEVDEYCQNVISKIEQISRQSKGRITKSQLKEQMTTMYGSMGKNPTQDQVNAFNKLSEIYNSMTSGESFYDVDIKTDSEKHAVMSTLNYLITCMPKNMQDALYVNTELRGNGDTMAEYLYGLIQSGTKDGYTQTVEPTTEDKVSTGKMHTIEQLIDGQYAQTLPFSIDQNTVVNFTGSVGPVFNRSLHAIGKSFLSTVIDATNMGSFIDQSQIYFGSEKIDPMITSNFIYDGGSQMLTEVPVDGRGNIDFDKFRKLSKAEQMISEAPNKTPEVIQTIYKKCGIPTTTKNGQIVPDLQTQRFFIFNAMTTTEVIDPEDIENPMFITQPEGDTADQLESYMEQLFEAGKATYPGGDPIKGLVFMKMAPNAPQQIYSLAGHGSKIDIPTLAEDQVKYNIQQSRQQNNFNAAGLDALK